MAAGDSFSASFALGVICQACTSRGSSIAMAPPPWLNAMRSPGCRAATPPVIIEAQARAMSPGKHTACSEKGPTMRSWPAGRSACTKIAAAEYRLELRVADRGAVHVAGDFDPGKFQALYYVMEFVKRGVEILQRHGAQAHEAL